MRCDGRSDVSRIREKSEGGFKLGWLGIEPPTHSGHWAWCTIARRTAELT